MSPEVEEPAHLRLRCKNCGADVVITSPATLLVTCAHCGTLSLRGDVDLETIGEVALPTPLPSRFQVGTVGRLAGDPFVVRGQIQLDHGAGLWNEWAAETDDGWIWIAEAQGELHVYREVEGAGVPSREMLPDVDADTGDFIPPPPGAKARWRAGDRISIEGAGAPWTIREIGRGRVVTFRGEFPIRMKPGTRTTYLDLSRGARELATLDFTRPGAAELLVGRTMAPEDLTLDPSTQPDTPPDAIESRRIPCAHCGGTIEVQDDARALTLGCLHCGTVLQRENQAAEYRAAELARKIRTKPAIPIGAQGTLAGEDLRILGFLERSVRAHGQRYPWREYLARTRHGEYRWLVESDGHWTLATPVPPTRFTGTGRGLRIGDATARPFSTGESTVDQVLGEFYWQVKVGERVEAQDYVAPKFGLMASMESSPLEAAASLARHLEPEAVARAFPGAKLPKRVGVGAIQPNPHAPGAAWKVFALLFLLLTASCVATRVTHANREVHRGQYGPSATVAGQEKVEFSEPFTIIEDGANVKVTLRASTVDNGHLAMLGALVHEETGEVTTFETAAQRYSGVSGGESWSEGNRRGSVLVGPVPAGTYRLRLATQPYDRATNIPYEVVVKSDVPRVLWYVLALLALLPFPIVSAIRAGVFETKRWSNSDFAG